MRHSPERDALCALMGLGSPPAESGSEAEGARADGQRATTRPGSSVVFSLVPAIEHAIGRLDLLMGMAENCKLGAVGPASASGPGDDRAGSPDDMSVGSSPEPEIGDVEMEQVAQGAGLRCDTPGPPAAAEENQDEEEVEFGEGEPLDGATLDVAEPDGARLYSGPVLPPTTPARGNRPARHTLTDSKLRSGDGDRPASLSRMDSAGI
mmetsp:Transcript_20606/g.66799  ORF Transcript_20606/g.66799 Transcript_20606/m.66799 type:complete len:208 (+) Transcript_20606:601-1224(+)